jgi:hypothetical protein
MKKMFLYLVDLIYSAVHKIYQYLSNILHIEQPQDELDNIEEDGLPETEEIEISILEDQEFFNHMYDNMSNPHPRLEEYIDVLSGEDEDLRQLMENSKKSIQIEGQISGISPISRLTFKTLSKLWPRVSMKHMIDVDVAMTPRFIVAYTEPYLFSTDEDDELIKLKLTDNNLDNHNDLEPEKSWSLGFDIGRKDIEIPVGQHVNAPLPFEFLQDTMALYDINGAEEVCDLMSNIISQRLDMEIIDFFEGRVSEVYEDEELPVFSAMPAADYAGTPKEWREKLVPVLLEEAKRIQQEFYLTNMEFRIAAHPIDSMLMTGVDWEFRGSNMQMSGVDVGYNMGKVSHIDEGTDKRFNFKIISSPNVPQGALYLVGIPKSESQMTYKYYPYTFNVEYAYLDPNKPKIPSILMSKRHTFQTFTDCISKIKILHNDGFSAYSGPSPSEWETL